MSRCKLNPCCADPAFCVPPPQFKDGFQPSGKPTPAKMQTMAYGQFLIRCRSAISMMREAGMHDAQIACVVDEIRAAVVNDEFHRIKTIIDQCPPDHQPWGVILDEIKRHD
jgi:hypothetical protein